MIIAILPDNNTTVSTNTIDILQGTRRTQIHTEIKLLLIYECIIYIYIYIKGYVIRV